MAKDQAAYQPGDMLKNIDIPEPATTTTVQATTNEFDQGGKDAIAAAAAAIQDVEQEEEEEKEEVEEANPIEEAAAVGFH